MATMEDITPDLDLFSFLFGDDNVGGEATNPCWIDVHEDEAAPQETTLVGGSEHKAGDVIVDQAGNQYQAVEDSEFVSARDAEELEDGSDIFMKPGCYTKAVLLPKVRKPRTRKALSPDLAALQLPADRKAKLVRGNVIIVSVKGPIKMTNTDQAAIKERLENALEETEVAEAYHDGYTFTVRTEENQFKDGYQLTVSVGAMPPHFSQWYGSLDGVLSELSKSTLPLGAEWLAVETD